MPKKLTILAACGASLALPTSAAAVDVPVNVVIQPIPNSEPVQYAWACEARANPVFVHDFNLWCNGQTAVGLSPVFAATGGTSATPTVCYRVSFSYGSGFPPQWASREDCVSL
jgi:hypothetical protein